MKLVSKVDKVRLDKFVVDHIPDLSRSFVSKLCDEGNVLVNKNKQNAKYKVKIGDKIHIKIDLDTIISVPNIEIPIIYEDKDVIVINKPAGILTHSKGPFNNEATVASFIEDKIDIPRDTSSANAREGIVHRLDRDTSGLIICAKTNKSAEWLQKQFADRKVEKTYIAVVDGKMDDSEAIFDLPIKRNPKDPKTFMVAKDGKPSETHYKVLKENANFSLLELHPKTGRTHQLRVHLKYAGHPIVGDPVYGNTEASRMLLHAKQLRILLPSKVVKTFETKLPKEITLDPK